MCEGDQIHLYPLAIGLAPTLDFDRQGASSLVRPTFTLSSSTYFFMFSSPSGSSYHINNIYSTQLSNMQIKG